MWSFIKTVLVKQESQEEEKYFIEYGSKVLEKLISSCNGKYYPFRMFSCKDIKRATNNFSHVHGSDFDHSTYKGTHDDRPILVKKFEKSRWKYRNTTFGINEVVMLSQLNHKNILRLLGCCLEFKSPVLVLEFVPNRFLSDLIYEKRDIDINPLRSCPPLLLSWENRIRIAMEIADAITYIHSATSRPIIHRDINPANILLDQNYVAKLFNFDLSITIPEGETHVEVNEIEGIWGLLAPEYMIRGRITEKIDVYGFGMLLLELLTGKHWHELFLVKEDSPVSLDYFWDTEKQHKSFFKFLDENNRFHEFVAPVILAEAGIDLHLDAYAELIVRCTKCKEEERPTMIEVAKELRRIKKMAKVMQG